MSRSSRSLRRSRERKIVVNLRAGRIEIGSLVAGERRKDSTYTVARTVASEGMFPLCSCTVSVGNGQCEGKMGRSARTLGMYNARTITFAMKMTLHRM